MYKTKKRSSFKPNLECLEDRCCPTSFTWHPLSNTDWNDNDNWGGVGQGYPHTASDTATFTNGSGYDVDCTVSASVTVGHFNIGGSYSKTINFNDHLVTLEGSGALATSTWNTSSSNTVVNVSGGLKIQNGALLEISAPLTVNNSSSWNIEVIGSANYESVLSLKGDFQNLNSSVEATGNSYSNLAKITVGAYNANKKVITNNTITIYGYGYLDLYQNSNGDTRGGITGTASIVVDDALGEIIRSGAGATLYNEATVSTQGLTEVSTNCGVRFYTFEQNTSSSALTKLKPGATLAADSVTYYAGSLYTYNGNNPSVTCTIDTLAFTWSSAGQLDVSYDYNTVYSTLAITGTASFTAGDVYLDGNGLTNHTCSKIAVVGNVSITGGNLNICMHGTPSATPVKFDYNWITSQGTLTGGFTNYYTTGNAPSSGWDWTIVSGDKLNSMVH